MKVLFVGTGGIGRRHGRNVRALRPDSRLIAVRREPSEATRELDMILAPDLDAGLAERPRAAVVALPPALHAGVACKILDAGIPLYLEKPVATHAEDLTPSAARAADRGVVTMAGCQLRYLPGLRKMHATLAEGRIGRIAHARLSVGQWLPAWRPGRDYRTTYSSNRALGGGVLLDLIHEIDLARFFFGEFDKVRARASNSGLIGVDCEDNADVLLEGAGPAVNVHLDALDRARHREGRVIGEHGTLIYDVNAGRLAAYDAAKGSWSEMATAGDFDLPMALMTAMRSFLDCVDRGCPTNQPIDEGLRSLALVERAQASANLI